VGVGVRRIYMTYYRLGKKRPCSGILSRYSRLALTIQTMPTMLLRTRPMTAVLPFQLLGWAYQPPAGDQTCLGYLRGISAGAARQLAGGAHGIFPPPPIVKCSRGGSVVGVGESEGAWELQCVSLEVGGRS
jgi:hypothetical protein